MYENKNQILVALDGSEKAFKTIEYLCISKQFFTRGITLFNVSAGVPDYYYDLKKEPFTRTAVPRVSAWELSYKMKMENFMEESRMMLIAAGFKQEAIRIVLQKRKKGIARDILAEAQKGYYALVIRRRGVASSLLPIVMGSVSTRLVEKAVNIPVFLAGLQKINHSIFIALDGSDGSKRAADFLADAVEGLDCRIVLCSVLRDYEVYDEKDSRKKTTELVRSAFDEIKAVHEETAKQFEAAGIKKEKIEKKIIQGAKSRAGAIMESAKEENCDTIVFGRKGRSDVADFDIGRVPWKVIQGAKEMTVWLVP